MTLIVIVYHNFVSRLGSQNDHFKKVWIFND